jgi:hypothetical protein
VAVDNGGNTFICGRNDNVLSFGGAVGTLNTAGVNDAFVAKLDSLGTPLWARVFADPTQQIAYTLALDGAGDVYVGGTFQGTVNFGGGGKLAVRHRHVRAEAIGRDGRDAVGSKVFGGPLRRRGAQRGRGWPGQRRRDRDRDRGSPPIDFGGGALCLFRAADDFALVKLDGAGNHIWSLRAGDNAFQRGLGVATDSQSNTLAVGSLKGAADFGGGPLTTAVPGTADVFVAKFAP